MPIIDAHCHASPIWYEPVETLLFQMDRCQVDRALLTQMIGQFDNSYQQASVAAHRDRLASVVLVDPASLNAGDDLQRLVDDGIAGIRIGAGVSNSALWHAADAHGLAISVSGSLAQKTAPEFIARIDSLKACSFVLEHLGGLAQPDFDGNEAAKNTVFELARFPHVFLKMPGLGQPGKRTSLAQDPPIDPNVAGLFSACVAKFGADRLMWGSDFPPVASREGYANALDWPMRALAHLSTAERDAIFGGTAARIFKFEG